jgi:hypothetical protein
MTQSQDRTLGDLIDIRLTRLIVMHDEWVGLNDHAPITAVYELRRGLRGGLVGEARFATGLVGQRILDVRIPASAAMQFLDAVARARVSPGPYVAHRDSTDDHPRIELAFHVDASEGDVRSGIAMVYTESQGELHAPWGALARGEVLTLPGDEIGRALAGIRKPLRISELQKLLR